VLDAARLNERQLMPEIKDIGMDWLWEWLNKQTGVHPNVFHYSAYISQLARRKRWSDAVELCASMPKAGVQADVITYDSFITACEKGGQWEQASATFEEMTLLLLSAEVKAMTADGATRLHCAARGIQREGGEHAAAAERGSQGDDC
jgi:pentatricopeptide repeat protein